MVDFVRRIEAGREYFEALDLAFTVGWREAFSAYSGSGQPVTLGLALVHPEWFEDQAVRPGGDIRGPRGFPLRAQKSGSCQAEVLWGYQCARVPLEVDHLFPYSLGGPTRPENGVLLCVSHNRLKGHDVHLLPWETYRFPWLAEQVEAAASRLLRV